MKPSLTLHPEHLSFIAERMKLTHESAVSESQAILVDTRKRFEELEMGDEARKQVAMVFNLILIKLDKLKSLQKTFDRNGVRNQIKCACRLLTCPHETDDAKLACDIRERNEWQHREDARKPLVDLFKTFNS